MSPDGALIFYDFGMMGQVSILTREKLLEVFFGVAQKDGDRVVASLVELGALAEADDMGPVRRSVQFMLDNFMDKPFENQSVSAISDDLYEIAYGQPFRFPATFTFVMRAFSTLEGVGKGSIQILTLWRLQDLLQCRLWLTAIHLQMQTVY